MKGIRVISAFFCSMAFLLLMSINVYANVYFYDAENNTVTLVAEGVPNEGCIGGGLARALPGPNMADRIRFFTQEEFDARMEIEAESQPSGRMAVSPRAEQQVYSLTPNTLTLNIGDWYNGIRSTVPHNIPAYVVDIILPPGALALCPNTRSHELLPIQWLRVFGHKANAPGSP